MYALSGPGLRDRRHARFARQLIAAVAVLGTPGDRHRLIQVHHGGDHAADRVRVEHKGEPPLVSMEVGEDATDLHRQPRLLAPKALADRYGIVRDRIRVPDRLDLIAVDAPKVLVPGARPLLG